MNLLHGYWASGAAAVVVLTIACAFLRGTARRILGNIVLLGLTVFVGAFLVVAFSNHKLGKTSDTNAADQAEMQLRVVAISRAFQSSMESYFQSRLGPHAVPSVPTGEADRKVEENAYAQAEKSLRLSQKNKPEIGLYKAKLIIVLGNKNRLQHRAEMEALLAKLSNLQGTGQAAANMRKLASVLERAYIADNEPESSLKADEATIRAALEAGWYRDQAILELSRATHLPSVVKEAQTRLQDRYTTTFYKLILIAAVFLLGALIGLIAIGVELALTSRTAVPERDEVGLNVPLKSVYAVFVSWFALQIFMSLAFHSLSAAHAWAAEQPLAVALGTAITYLLSNAPGPLLIYYLALRPQGLDFWKALRIRLKTPTAGPVKLFASGLLGWCSAIPLVATAAILASRLLKTQGSDNPVLGQIMQAAGASSLPSTLVFYLTLGVMAPFFEEILFRGFIFASLKTKVGTTAATIISAALFAVMHFDRGGLLPLFAIGIVLAVVFDRTRSLVPSMITHGLWNSGTFTFALLIFSS